MTTHPTRARSLDALFRPRSVAVIGASRRAGSIGREILRALVDGGFAGKVFPVNPKAKVIHSIKCHPCVTAIPDAIDLAVIVVPQAAVARALARCARKGVGGVVVITAGFRETGPEGAAEEARLLRIARRHQMRLVGPNCMGIQNAEEGVRLNASFSRSFPRPGPAAFVSQSGAMGEAILAQADRLNLGVTMLASLGNRADISANDLLEYWEDIDQVRCVLLYLESFGNPRHFVPIARRVSRKKAIVVVKAGRSAAGALAAQSHTGALAGADVAAGAVLADCGVQRVDTVEELFDVALALSRLPLPAGDRVAVLTNAGGPAILATDALVASGLQMAPLLGRTRRSLRSRLPPEASVRNPVDMIAGAGEREYRQCLALLLADPSVDTAIVIFVPPITHDPVAVARAVFDVAHGSPKPVVGCFMSRDEVLRDISTRAVQDWVPVYLYPESAVRALRALEERRRILERSPGRVKRFRVDPARVARALRSAWPGALDWRELCRAYGIPVPDGGLARSAEEAVALARRVGHPVSLKVSSPAVVHASDVAGVLLDVEGDDAVRQAYRRLYRRSCEGVLVQAMVRGAQEVVAGFAADPTFGPIHRFGLGGIHVEVLKDVTFAPCPVSDVRARELVSGIRGWPILAGYRGRPGVDKEALVVTLQRLSQLALDNPALAGLEINPLMARTRGVVAVDVRLSRA